jgi:hypothetical protein
MAMRARILVLSTLLSACAAYDGSGLRPGVSTAEEAVRTMGPPALEIPNPDGSKSLAYPKGYYSGQTFMVRVGKDGLVQRIDQVLNEDHFYRIVPGITRDDVLRLIGPPIEVMDFARLQQTAWDYRYQDAWGYTAILSVMIDRQGIVVGRTSRRIEPRDRGR